MADLWHRHSCLCCFETIYLTMFLRESPDVLTDGEFSFVEKQASRRVSMLQPEGCATECHSFLAAAA
jgi:hypothetical protein